MSSYLNDTREIADNIVLFVLFVFPEGLELKISWVKVKNLSTINHNSVNKIYLHNIKCNDIDRGFCLKNDRLFFDYYTLGVKNKKSTFLYKNSVFEKSAISINRFTISKKYSISKMFPNFFQNTAETGHKWFAYLILYVYNDQNSHFHVLLNVCEVLRNIRIRYLLLNFFSFFIPSFLRFFPESLSVLASHLLSNF